MTTYLTLTRTIAAAATCLAMLFPAFANAGRNCEDAAPDAAKTQKALRFATQIRESLELSGANLVLIGRVGSDQSKRGIRYTHVGYLLREHPAGAWTVIHQLNACGTGSSDLFDEGLANFFMDDPFDFETRFVVPSPALQDAISKALLGSSKRAMHEQTYSSIAYPWSTKHQNSNGWALEILAAAIASPTEISNRGAAQKWLNENRYQPSQIRINGGERAGARLFSPHIRFGDHPDTAWQTQTYEVSTGDSVLEFLRRTDPGSRMVTQRLDSRPVLASRPKSDTRISAARLGVEPTNPPPPATVAPPVQPVAPDSNSQSRSQILKSMQGLIIPYACRPQGYLNQCRQLERGACERQVSDAVLRCFATVSDQQLFNGSEQAAMQQMQEVGYCAVESVEASLAAGGRQAKTAQGKVCPPVRNFK
ncbi:MAG: DUF2145 domain-containing protein [Rhodocyclales bacterium]|nr:DUF2145 domain-containing protein [Rhodocyclales bacterium]